MVTSISQAKEIYDKWQKLKSDKVRLDFLVENAHQLKIMLDNDHSFVVFIRGESMQGVDELMEMEYAMESFDQYFGENDSIVLLFSKLGITADPV